MNDDEDVSAGRSGVKEDFGLAGGKSCTYCSGSLPFALIFRPRITEQDSPVQSVFGLGGASSFEGAERLHHPSTRGKLKTTYESERVGCKMR